MAMEKAAVVSNSRNPYEMIASLEAKEPVSSRMLKESEGLLFSSRER